VRGADGTWHAVPWVKRGILVGFRFGKLADLSPSGDAFSFVDKDTIPPQRFGIDRGVRIVPGGSSIRRGVYVAPGVVCLMYVLRNDGSTPGEGRLMGFQPLVGAC